MRKLLFIIALVLFVTGAAYLGAVLGKASLLSVVAAIAILFCGVVFGMFVASLCATSGRADLETRIMQLERENQQLVGQA